MVFFVFLAFLNGLVIGTSRAINGQLSTVSGPFRASLWNHVGGFVFLTVVVSVLGDWERAAGAPSSAYLGGFFGALFVAVNSHVFARLGAMNAVLLVISGQMISAVVIDYVNQDLVPTPLQLLGVVIVLFGVYYSRRAKAQADKDEP